MIIESGFIVAAGLMIMFWKCSWKWKMKMLSNPLTMDVLIFIILNWIHWGTFSGLMVAAVGALVCSALISLGKFCFGFYDGKIYIPGIWNIGHRLTA